MDVLVVTAGAEVEATGSLNSGPILGGDRDAEGRGIWVASGESRVGRGDGIKEPTACLSHNVRLPDFYVAVMNAATVNELMAIEGGDAALLKAECPGFDANPDDGRARGFSNFSNAKRFNTSPVHTRHVQTMAKAAKP